MQNYPVNFGDSIRIQSPEKTLQSLAPIFDKIGITRIANVTHLDHFYGIFISNCIRPNSQNLSISQGRGSSLILSDISAIMESVEAYHAENPPNCKFKGSFAHCYSDKLLVNPNLLYSNKFAISLEEIEFEWSEAYNIFDNKRLFIPTSITRINTCLPSLDYFYFDVSSNGLAAGNSKEEAMYHAICEIIERDALTKWQQLDLSLKNECRVAVNTVDDFNQDFISKLQQNHLKLKIWEITSNLGVPTYHVAIIDQQSIRNLNIFTGTGTHLSKSIALFRAISEGIQGRLAHITGVRDDLFFWYYKKLGLNDKKFIPQEDDLIGKSYSNCVSLPVKDVVKNLEFVLNIIRNYKYEQVLMVDHTKPDLNIPVVQIFIPGMLLNNSRM